MSEYPAFATGVLSIIGGSIGYARKGSLPSLLGGAFVGVLYIYSANLLRKNPRELGGLRATLASTAVLLVSSLPRARKGPVPALLSVLGLFHLVYYGRAYFRR
ncbi:hypothetical protein BDM02DRAFT_3108945 [Thelephora ganbajun]|uniref:Uncharacterized protein n=1 Tax=Thelephora ganbajun TaxID=370292 RepID=A0ACB6ZSG6_THEGA|nr:hypothetical protein BDM02DRAFT_3108945 [Thelephora ganbajun]